MSDVSPIVTPETLSDVASKVDIGPMDGIGAMSVKLCEARVENKYIATIGDLKSQISVFEVKYKNVLRELSDALISIKFDDFLKVIIGLLGGFITGVVFQKGFTSFNEPGFALAGVVFIISLIFLVYRYFWPSKRKKEITEELNKLTG